MERLVQSKNINPSELERVLNGHIKLLRETSHGPRRLIVLGVDQKSGKFECLGDADRVDDLPEAAVTNPSAVILKAFQIKAPLGNIIFGYETDRNCYGCSKDMTFVSFCRRDIFNKPPKVSEKNLNQLHLVPSWFKPILLSPQSP